MQRINIVGVGIVEFPDGMTQDQIANAIENDILPSIRANAPAPKAPFSFADTALSLQQGTLGVAKSIADVFGADTAVSKGMAEAQKHLSGLYTPERQKEIEYYRQQEEAAAKEGPLAEAGAAARSVLAAPIQSTAQAVGSIIPNLLSLLIPGAGEARAAVAARTVFNVVLGAIEGTGAVKGTIYDNVKAELEKTKMSPEEASRIASEAQEYVGKNWGQIATGAGIGAAVGKYGVEQILSGGVKGIGRKVATAGVEAGTEAGQATQEQIAANIAAQREGIDVDTLKGVPGAATKEGLMGILGTTAVSPLGGGEQVQAPVENKTQKIIELLKTADARTNPELARLADAVRDGEVFLEQAIQIVDKAMAEQAASQQQVTTPEEEVAPPVIEEVGAPVSEEVIPPVASAEEITAPTTEATLPPEFEETVDAKELRSLRKQEAMRGEPAVKTEEALEAEKDIGAVTKELNKLKNAPKQAENLWSALMPNKQGVLTESDVKDIGSSFKFKALQKKDGEGTSISTLVRNGALDDFLPFDLRSDVIASSDPTEQMQKENDAQEIIKQKIRDANHYTYETELEIKQLDNTAFELENLLKEHLEIDDVNSAIQEAADEQRTIDEASKEFVPEGEVGAAESVQGEAAAPQEVKEAPEIKIAKDLLAAIDKGGVPLSTAKLNNVARDIGLDVSKSAKPEETIQRIRDAVERTESLGAKDESISIEGKLSSKMEPSSGALPSGQTAQPFVINKSAEDEKVEKELTGKSILEVAQWAVYNAPNKFAKIVAQKVLNRLNGMAKRGIKMEFEIFSGPNRPSSMWGSRGRLSFVYAKIGKPIPSSIKLDLNGAAVMDNQNGYPPGVNYQTILHELLHAATTAQLQILLSTDPLVKELRDLFNIVVKHFNAEHRDGRVTPFMDRAYRREINAFADPDELLAWGLTDKNMQLFLDSIKIDNQTAFSKLVEIIRKILNITTQYKTALDELIRTTESILDEDIDVVAGKMIARGYSFGLAPKTKATPTGETIQGSLFQKEVNLTPTAAGKSALDAIKDMGFVRKPPEQTSLEKTKELLKNSAQNPSLTAKEGYKTYTKFMDKVQTWSFSADAALNNSYRRAIAESGRGVEERIGNLLNISLSQTVHADAVASQALIHGRVEYNADMYKWEVKKDKDNFVSLSKQLDVVSEKYGLSKEDSEAVAHKAFEAKRLKSLVKFNESIANAPLDIADLNFRLATEQLTADQKKDIRNEISRLTSLAGEKPKFIHMTDEQIEKGLGLFETIPELKGLVDTWNGMRKNTIDVLVDSGLWTKEDAEKMLDNIDYVPFYREEQLEKFAGPKEFVRGLQVQSKEKMIKGSSKPVNDVFDNMARWMQYAINRSIRNRSAVALADAAVEMNLGTKMPAPKPGANNVSIWRDGKQEFYNMEDPMYMDAFNGLEAVAIPTIKYASKMATLLRQSIVLNPLFAVSQLPQDAFASIFSSGLKPQYALRIPVLAVKEFIQTLRGKSLTHEKLKMYGATGVKDFSSAAARIDAEVYSGMRASPGIKAKIKGILEHIAMASDNAVRQAVYEASISQGVKPSEALEKAFEVINFRRRGSSKMIAMAGQVIPFFNAYLAAQNVAIKTISGVGISPSDRKDALATLAATTGSVMALSLLYAMMNGDDEDYLRKTTTIRDRMLMIPGTGGFGIPLRMDLFTIPKVITEHVYLLMTDKGAEDGRKFRDSMKAALGTALLAPTPVPQVIKPLVEVAINYDFFQGKPLIGQWQKGLELDRQFNDSTSELAKLFGNTGMVSPIAADHLMRGMFGSVGGLTILLTNPILHSDPMIERPEMSMKEAIAAVPGAGSFMTKQYESSLKTDFYVLRDEVDKVANTLSDLKKRNPDQIDAYLEKEGVIDKLALAKTVNKVGKYLSSIRSNITYIRNAPSSEYTTAEKAAEIKELREIEQDILKSLDIKDLRKSAGL